MRSVYKITAHTFNVRVVDANGENVLPITLTAEKVQNTRAFTLACKAVGQKPTFGNAVCFVRVAAPFIECQQRDELLANLATVEATRAARIAKSRKKQLA